MAYLQVYTGNGKGKTTAAFGVALRASCAGWKVFVGQFVKGMIYNEAKCGHVLPHITVEQWGRTCILEGEAEEEDRQRARDGLAKAETIISSGEWNLVILDELSVAQYLKLIEENDVLEMLDKRHPDTEVIVTGRYATERLLARADLVTEMKEIKHYYTQGVLSRSGIDC